jgi:hypothetical protein
MRDNQPLTCLQTSIDIIANVETCVVDRILNVFGGAKAPAFALPARLPYIVVG